MGHNQFVTCAFFMSGRHRDAGAIVAKHFAAFSDISKKSDMCACADPSNGLTVLSHTALAFVWNETFFGARSLLVLKRGNYRTRQP
jgi:hypothetical protein